MKVVINKKHGGFGISDEAAKLLIKEYGWTVTEYADNGYEDPEAQLVDTGADGIGGRYRFTANRDDPELRSNEDLVSIVENRDVRVNGPHASLKVVEVPDDVEFTIEEYDGLEWVAEKHRTWG